MENMTNEELISEGLKLLDAAVQHFMEVSGSPHADAIAKAAHGLLMLAEMIYSSYQK